MKTNDDIVVGSLKMTKIDLYNGLSEFSISDLLDIEQGLMDVRPAFESGGGVISEISKSDPHWMEPDIVMVLERIALVPPCPRARDRTLLGVRGDAACWR